MTREKDPRSLDLCAVGLGQGGGNLAAEWRRRGYRALLFNTAATDLRALSHHEGLGVPDELVVDIALEGTEGAGKDPDYGAACVRAHADEIRAAVETRLKGADGLLVCAGLGGGTGSAVPELLRVLEPVDIPIISVATLPSNSESGIAKVNAVRAANSLVAADLAGRVFIDNDRLVGAHGDLDLISWFPAVNARVLAPLDELNRLNRRPEMWSVRTFDGEDLRKVLLSGGVLQTHVARLSADRGIDAEYLVEVVAACVDGGNHLARGLELSQVAYLALVVTGPEEALRATSMQDFDDAVRELKQRTGGGAVYEGLYVAPDDAPLRAYVLSASLALPTRIQDLLGDARSEGTELARKIQEEIPGLEVSPLEGLELFRTPTRRPVAQDRPPAPEPRSLASQLAGEVESLEDMARPASVDLPSGEDPGPPESWDEESVKPRVGTGRYDEEEAAQMEPTQVARGDEAEALLGEAAKKAKKKKSKKAKKKKSKAAKAAAEGSATPRVGSGRWDPELVAQADEPTAYVDADERDPLRRETVAYDSVNLPDEIKKQREPLRPATDRAALLPEDAPVDYDLDDDAESFELEGNVTSPDAKAREAHQPVGEDESEESTATYADQKNPGGDVDDDLLLRSVISQEPEGPELQGVYEDLIERYRQAASDRDRDRVVRRLKDDARADDVEVRALSVWAMVKLEDPVFERALKRSVSDGNAEIARLARSGLDRL